MLVGVAPLPNSRPLEHRILLHNQAKLRKDMQHSVYHLQSYTYMNLGFEQTAVLFVCMFHTRFRYFGLLELHFRGVKRPQK